MPNPVAVLRECTFFGDESRKWRMLQFWCPGCDSLSEVNLVGPDGFRREPTWEWDGNLDAPTVSPSILTEAIHKTDGTVYSPRCHSFLRAGRWEFLTDCTHALAGQTVDMVPLPDWLVR